MSKNMEGLRSAFSSVQSKYRGPGGAVAVVKDGQLSGHHTWGFANLESNEPMTSDTIIPICSISKQMLCATILDLERNPPPQSTESGKLRERMQDSLDKVIQLDGPQSRELKIDHLCHNQSGIRDYWALTVLWGALPDQPFEYSQDAVKALERIKDFHFAPGTQYAYCNTGFVVLTRLLELSTGEKLEDSVQKRIFERAGMKNARYCIDSGNYPGPIAGYEGSEETGYVAASNAIQWKGDAGVGATLSDMIAYEIFLDKSMQEPDGLFRKMSEQPSFGDGTEAQYGFGLVHGHIRGLETIGHSGMLRGFRLHRLYVPSERMSVVVLFNHEGDAAAAAGHILAKVLGVSEQAESEIRPAAEWEGLYYDFEDGLLITVTVEKTGSVSIDYAGSTERLKLTQEKKAMSQGMEAVVDGDVLSIHRIAENRKLQAHRLEKGPPSNSTEYTGTFRSEAIDSNFTCTGEGDLLYGSFKGFLGRGPAHLIKHAGGDVWLLQCPRSMDAPSPGYWTVQFRRNQHNAIEGVQLSCWLARKLEFTKENSTIPLR